jgi:hypothetical protein
MFSSPGGFSGLLILCFCFISGGCASRPARLSPEGGSAETAAQQIDAVQKVVSGMTGRQVSSEDMRRVAREVEKDPESRAVMQKILSSGSVPREKYSPATGKHYSAELEFDPETGVRLEFVD